MLNGLNLSWPWNPGVILLLLILSLLYVLGLRNAGRYQSENEQEQPVKPHHPILFFSAIVIMALVLLTPIDTIARTQLFSVHMAQLVILTTLCAPFILLGCPTAVVRPLAELPVIRDIIRVLTKPLIASISFNLIFLLWHAPRLFDLALKSSALYHIEVLSIFVASLLNWWPLLGSVRELRRMSYPLQMLYAFFDGQPVDIFAFVLVFTGVSIYPYYASTSALSNFPDQAVGGAILLIPGLVDLGVMSPLFIRWLGQIENQTKLADQRRAEEQEEYDEDEYEDEDDYEEDEEDGSEMNNQGMNNSRLHS